MNRLMIDAFDYVDESYLDAAAYMVGRNAANKRAPGAGKRLKTILLAAALAALLSATAYAVGSAHLRAQARLYDELNIAEARAEGYVEYALPQEDTGGGVVMLSAINDGEFHHVYIDIAPVERDTLLRNMGGEEGGALLGFFWSFDGESWGMAEPYIAPSRQLVGVPTAQELLMDAYDEAAKTLTLELIITAQALEDAGYMPGDEVELTLSYIDVGAQALDAGRPLMEWFAACDDVLDGVNDGVFGRVKYTLLDSSARKIILNDAVIVDDATGTPVTIASLELTPMSAVWRLRFEGMELLSAGDNDAAVELLQMEDRILSRLCLRLDDGSEFDPGLPIAGGYTDGAAECKCTWKRALKLDAVAAITADGEAIHILK